MRYCITCGAFSDNIRPVNAYIDLDDEHDEPTLVDTDTVAAELAARNADGAAAAPGGLTQAEAEFVDSRFYHIKPSPAPTSLPASAEAPSVEPLRLEVGVASSQPRAASKI